MKSEGLSSQSALLYVAFFAEPILCGLVAAISPRHTLNPDHVFNDNC